MARNSSRGTGWRLNTAALFLLAFTGSAAFADPPTAPNAHLVERGGRGDAQADYLLGEFYLKRAGDGDPVKAAASFRASLQVVDGDRGKDNDTSLQLLDRLIAALDLTQDSGALRDAAADRLERLERMRPDATDTGEAWITLGSAQMKAEAFADSLRSEREARAVFENNIADSSWNPFWVAATFFNEGLDYQALHQVGAAEVAFSEAARRYRAIRASGEGEIAARSGDYLEKALLKLVDAAAARKDDAAEAARRRETVDLLRETRANSAELGLQLLGLAKLYSRTNDPAGALPLFDEARTIRRTLGAAPAAIASIDWERGIAFYNLGDKQKALDAYLQAAGGLDPTSANFDADVAALWGNIAGCQADLNQPAKQRDALAKAIGALRRSQPGSTVLADKLQLLSGAQTASGQTQAAVASAEEGVAIRKAKQPDTLELATALDGLGRARLALNDLPGAAADFREATAIGLKADPATKGSAIVTRVMLGITLYKDRHYDEAIDELDGALDWVDTVAEPNKANTAIALGNLAWFNLQTGRYADAEATYKRLIPVLRGIHPNSTELGNALYGLAMTYYYLARFDDALPAMREAETVLRVAEGDKSEAVIDTLTQQGWILEGADRFDEALQMHAAAVADASAVAGSQSFGFAVALSGHAWTLRRLNRFKESAAEFETALAIFRDKLGPADQVTGQGYVNLALVKQLLGENQEAVQLGMRALSIFDRDARTTLDGQRWASEALSLAFRDLGDRKRAILFAKQAINVQQKLRSFNKSYSAGQMTGFRNQWHRLYENLADMLIAEGRIGEAQSVLAMEKEEEFVNFIQRDASVDTREDSAALTPREDAERSKVDAIVSGPMADAAAVTVLIQKRDAGALSADEEARLNKLEGALDDAYAKFTDDVDAFLAASATETTGVQKEVEAINLNYTADIQDQLRAFDGGAVMLQIASLGDTTHLFLTAPEASVHREVKIKRADLAKLVFAALNAVQNRDPAADRQLKALYDVLVAPVAIDLKASGAKTVMLNLQGFLRYVPFAALTDGKRYFVEDYSLALYTPAAQTKFAAMPRAPDKSAGFGVTAAHPGFLPLPGVAQEIGAIFGGNGAHGALSGAASLDDKFTRDSFQAALRTRPSIVHIASHFKLVPGRETDSFLLLGDGSALSLADIRKGRGLRFGGVDLLTLSACETARGSDEDEADGGEFESFGALAQMNGASSVMATLWPVADAETAALMKSFYLHMMAPGTSKAEALREAQLEAIHGTAAVSAVTDRGAVSLVADSGPVGPSHPYYWSPFVLMGNWM